jgi:S-formylglutathione hydrolase FrmB
MLGLHGDLHIDFIESPALAGNALGDPSERPVIVYTPPGYDAAGSARYPVHYVLHGYTGTGPALIASRPWETNVAQWIDRLIVEKEMAPSLLAIVDGFSRFGGSQYVDSIHNGDYATYTVRDVVGHVDGTYRTIAREGGRSVLGKSSGGFGAMHLAMEHPGVFAAFASHSGDSYFAYTQTPSFPNAHRVLEQHHYDLGAFVDWFEAQHKRKPEAYTTMEMLGYASAYSPRSATAFDIDLPFRRDTGALDEAVFDRWLAFDPAERVAGRRKQLDRLRLRYLDCGRRDEYGLDIGARVVTERIRDLGLQVEHQEFDDDHRNIGYRYAVSLPALTAVLDRE